VNNITQLNRRMKLMELSPVSFYVNTSFVYIRYTLQGYIVTQSGFRSNVDRLKKYTFVVEQQNIKYYSHGPIKLQSTGVECNHTTGTVDVTMEFIYILYILTYVCTYEKKTRTRSFFFDNLWRYHICTFI